MTSSLSKSMYLIRLKFNRDTTILMYCHAVFGLFLFLFFLFGGTGA
jgi:hypothetical protein